MSITVGDNFSYQGAKPLDSRIQFASVADMKAYPEASLYNGCLAYITAVKKNYQYDSSNTVDTTTGRWRELEAGGGGGTSDYNDLTNKPQIAGVTLSGNQSLASFGLTSNVESQSSGSSTKSYVSRGEKYDWNTGNTVYGICSTSASTTAKSVTVSRGTLNFTAGAKIAIKFSYTNTASAPTLTISGTTKNIKYIDADGNVSTPLIWWNAGDVVEFTYDGTQWLMQPTMQMLFSGQGTKIPRESIYSTTEKVVGCWTDGRPIYQKTINFTMPTPTAEGIQVENVYAVGSTIRAYISIDSYFVTSAGVAIKLDRFPHTNTNTYAAVVGCTNSYTTTSQRNSIKVQNSYLAYGGASGCSTIKYTKTTDSANSFNYGDPNEYSTTEKIVGTWIDGKTLYQKTINFGALPNATTKTSPHGISNLATVVDIRGFFKSTITGATVLGAPISYAGNSTTNNGVEVWATASNIVIRTEVDLSQMNVSYVTIQYTKS